MRDNKMKVIVGVRKDGPSWKAAIKDGWVPGKSLFPLEDALCKNAEKHAKC